MSNAPLNDRLAEIQRKTARPSPAPPADVDVDSLLPLTRFGRAVRALAWLVFAYGLLSTLTVLTDRRWLAGITVLAVTVVLALLLGWLADQNRMILAPGICQACGGTK